MHDPKRAKKSTQANAGACAQQSRERQKIKQRFSDKEQYIFELRHRLLSLHTVRCGVKAPPLRVPTRPRVENQARQNRLNPIPRPLYVKKPKRRLSVIR